MPEKGANLDALKLLDVHFRQLRFDGTEQIVDACYDAFQRAVWNNNSLQYRFETPRGVRYSLLGDVKFEGCRYHRYDGALFRLSFDCPSDLRRFALLKSDLFGTQKLCSLIAIHEETSEINVIHFEVKERQPSVSENALIRDKFASHLPLNHDTNSFFRKDLVLPFKLVLQTRLI